MHWSGGQRVYKLYNLFHHVHFDSRECMVCWRHVYCATVSYDRPFLFVWPFLWPDGDSFSLVPMTVSPGGTVHLDNFVHSLTRWPERVVAFSLNRSSK